MSQQNATTQQGPQELSLEQQEQVAGGSGQVLVPTEECPTCVSGVDPTVQQARFQSSLTSDL
jgi:uncharacterized membrane-anchored protein